jgi:hypothetical protein
MGFCEKGWFREQDENATCQDGYQKKPKTHRESQEGSEVKAGIVQADPSCRQDQSRKIKRWKLS